MFVSLHVRFISFHVVNENVWCSDDEEMMRVLREKRLKEMKAAQNEKQFHQRVSVR